jgi:hypothetical protein
MNICKRGEVEEQKKMGTTVINTETRNCKKEIATGIAKKRLR